MEIDSVTMEGDDEEEVIDVADDFADGNEGVEEEGFTTWSADRGPANHASVREWTYKRTRSANLRVSAFSRGSGNREGHRCDGPTPLKQRADSHLTMSSRVTSSPKRVPSTSRVSRRLVAASVSSICGTCV